MRLQEGRISAVARRPPVLGPPLSREEPATRDVTDAADGGGT